MFNIIKTSLLNIESVKSFVVQNPDELVNKCPSHKQYVSFRKFEEKTILL